MRARPSAIAVFPTPASPTYSGLFLRRRHRISMVRSTSRVRPISGSILPSCASWLRLAVYLSSALPPSPSRSGPSLPASSFAVFSSAIFDKPCETKLTTSRRVTSARFKRCTAWLCFSLKMAMSTFATPTSFLPDDCTWNTARCRTRWKPSVGCTSRSSSLGSRGVVRSRCSLSESLRRARSAPQARRISRTFGVSRMDSNRCSTVRNSWRASRALAKASFKQNSSSCDNTFATSRPLDHPESQSSLLERAHQGMMMVTGVGSNQGNFGFRYFICEHTTDAFALGMYLEHDACRSHTVHTEELLQDIDDELHGRVIVVEQHHLI